MVTYSTLTQSVCYVSVKFKGGRSIVVVVDDVLKAISLSPNQIEMIVFV